jgi:hypothetical protein
MNEQIFENLYGEKQHEQAAKLIANVALNSYVFFNIALADDSIMTVK